MRKTLIKTFVLAALLLTGIISYAVPADPKPVTVKQPNGKTLTFWLQGDERVHWAVTSDGYTLLQGKNGNWCYAVKDNNGDMVASKVLASNANERNQQELSFVAQLQKDLRYSNSQIKSFKQAWQPATSVKDQVQPHFPPKGQPRLLVILVGFSDLEFTSDKSLFEDMCYKENYNGTGSIRDYFLTNSNGLLDLQIDVVGPFTLPNAMKFYGNNESNDAYYKFVRDALAVADSSVDFSQYDYDNDGKVDDVAFIFAGTPESSTGNADEIWPHSAELNNYKRYGGMITVDGVKVNRYTCSAEQSTKGISDATIGTFCHEFGHALGLPDEYDTDYGTNGDRTLNVAVATEEWSVMCSGSYNNNSNSPALWSAAQKIYTDWIDTIITLDSPADSLRLPLINGNNDTAYRINLTNNEFLIIEHRSKHGFDAYIPGEGLLVYHGQMDKIQAWFNEHKNTINADPQDRGWFIEPADGVDNKVKNLSNHIGTSAASFPGSTSVRYYTESSPNVTRLVKGDTVHGVSITDIQYLNDSVIIFNYNSSRPMVETNSTADSITLNSFIAGGKVLYKGSQDKFKTKGIVYSTDEECPYDQTNTVVDESENADEISAKITGLQVGTRYYYRAFVITEDDILGLGNIKFATTADGLGFVTTSNASDIDSNSVTFNGKLNSVGLGDFVEQGFVYTSDASITPTLDEENCFKATTEGMENGDYKVKVTGLEQGYTYYFRAYITNIYGTFYGTKKSVQTLYPAITGNTITAKQSSVCENSIPEEITGEQPAGGFGNFTFRWEQKTSSYGSWSEAEGVNNQTNYRPENPLTSTIYYRRVVFSDNLISSVSNEIAITVKASKGGTIVPAATNYNVGETATLRVTAHTGSVLQWEKSTDSVNFVSLGNEGETSLEQTFDVSGDFYYRVQVQIDECEPAYSSIKTIHVLGSALEDVENGAGFEITPNPSCNGTFTINTAEGKAQSMVITNTLGQVIYHEKDVDLNNKTVTLQNAQNGTYIINITVNDKLMTGKLIINK